MNNTSQTNADFLLLKRIGIDTHQEAVIYMREDCHVCRAEGFSAQARIRVVTDSASIIATLNIVTSEILSHQEVGLSEEAWRVLQAYPGQKAYFCYARPVDSMNYVRSKLYGIRFTPEQCQAIIADINERRYSDIQLSSYITACAGESLNKDEITEITRAMINVGKRFTWSQPIVMDKHCVGGLPGNRTTPIVVAIVTANGLMMPKTSSRAITSPAGTADTMEALTTVTLSHEQMRTVVEQEGGCIAWGGSVSLSPTDDIIIRVERALDLDSEGQLVASVISKKVAAGSTHVVIDIPVGPTAKVSTYEKAAELAKLLVYTGRALGLVVKTMISDGNQPVGRGIGPALEARDVLQVLQQSADAPKDLQSRSLTIAGALLELGGLTKAGEGIKLAEQTLRSGKAWEKFQSICEAQGGLKTLTPAPFTHTVRAQRSGVVAHIHAQCLSRLAKLAGAPGSPSAGIDLHARLGDDIQLDQALFTIHSEAKGELQYALDFLTSHPETLLIEDRII
jgi:thymidine phosphorylase